MEILMPINEKFIEVFEVFMNDEQKSKIRANSVRQYIEGIIDLLLKDKITHSLKPSEDYNGINWGRKIKIIENYYDKDIAKKIQFIFRIGGDGSHFSGNVSDDDLNDIISKAIHIVEDIFVKYFLTPEHRFGNENIFTVFSLLPLNNRIYILEKVYNEDKNLHVVDRLSLAYFKFGEKEKAIKLLEEALSNNIIDEYFKNCCLDKFDSLEKHLTNLQEMNKNFYKSNSKDMAVVFEDCQIIIGLPSSKDVFETARAVNFFDNWFKENKNEYREFINLFLALMATDKREYE